jgi:hypothetical protein
MEGVGTKFRMSVKKKQDQQGRNPCGIVLREKVCDTHELNKEGFYC